MITFDLEGTGGFSARVELQQQADVDRNCSRITATLYIISTRWHGVTYWLQGSANGRSFSSSYDPVYADTLGEPAQAGDSWHFTVDHDPQGAANLTFTLSLRGYTQSGNYGNGWKIEGSRTVALDPIMLASTLQITEGAETTIAINRRNSGYQHLLQYSFGSLSGYITDMGACSESPVICEQTVIKFPIPEDFYYQIPNSPTGTCTLTCITMDGDRQVGSAVVAPFTVTVPKIYAPKLTPIAIDWNEKTLELTGDPHAVVRFKSQMEYIFGVEFFFGATGEHTQVEGTEKLIYTITDSRGYSTTEVLIPKLIPYVELTVNGSCSRVDPVGGYADLTVRGSCFWGDFGTRQNDLVLTATVDGRTYELSPVAHGESYSAAIRLEDLSYQRSYVITVCAKDALSEVSMELELGRGEPVFDWGRGDFAFHVPVTAPMVNGIKNPALKAWPVGAVMLTATDPAPIIGGTWAYSPIAGYDAWRRCPSPHALGTGLLGALILGTEE